MSNTGWRQSLLQGVGTRIEVMAELHPRAYLGVTAVFALAGFACLMLCPLLVLAGVAGMYQSLAGFTAIEWRELLAWSVVVGCCGLASYRLIRFRPAFPAGIVLDREQAPSLFQLVEDTAGHYGCTGIDHIVVTGTYRLDIVSTPCRGLPVCSTRSLVIGLPLMQCLSTTRFGCLLARRLGQYSRQTNPLVNWLCVMRDIWPHYRASAAETGFGFLPVRALFSIYAPLYTAVSTAAVRLDELHADSYAMELFSHEEVLDAITADTVYRLFLREKYWPAIRKLNAKVGAAVTKSNAGMKAVLHAGLQSDTTGLWIEKAMSMEQQWDDPWPLLVRRLDNVGHVQAHMDTHLSESAAVSYIAKLAPTLKAALENIQPPEYPGIQSWSVRMAGLQRSVHSTLHGLLRKRENAPHPQ